MNAGQVWRTANLGTVAPATNWSIVGSDAKGNILWRNTTTGDVSVWLVAGNQITSTVGLGRGKL